MPMMAQGNGARTEPPIIAPTPVGSNWVPISHHQHPEWDGDWDSDVVPENAVDGYAGAPGVVFDARRMSCERIRSATAVSM
jgi:hypothetical protein